VIGVVWRLTNEEKDVCWAPAVAFAVAAFSSDVAAAFSFGPRTLDLESRLGADFAFCLLEKNSNWECDSEMGETAETMEASFQHQGPLGRVQEDLVLVDTDL